MKGLTISQLFDKAFNYFLDFLPALLLGLFVLIVFFLLSNLFSRLVRRIIKKYAEEPLIASFFGNIAHVTVFLLGVMLTLSIWGLGNISDRLLAGAGIITFVVGFAMQDIGKNFLSGIILAFGSPFKVGNVIESQGLIGVVEDMNLRQTHIKSFDGKDIFIPNASILTNPLQNYTIDGFLRYDFIVGVDYGSDLDKATDIITETLSTFEDVYQGEGKKPTVWVSNLNTNAVDISVFYWVNLPYASKSILILKSQVITKVVNELTRNGFHIPTSVVEFKNFPIPQNLSQ